MNENKIEEISFSPKINRANKRDFKLDNKTNNPSRIKIGKLGLETICKTIK